jgi:hypothetical protein
MEFHVNSPKKANALFLLILQHFFKTSEWFVRGRRFSIPLRFRLAERLFIKILLMLIVVTVETEQLPVAAVRRIIIVVVVLVMDRELAELLA